jgi:hypothetical protein
VPGLISVLLSREGCYIQEVTQDETRVFHSVLLPLAPCKFCVSVFVPVIAEYYSIV